MRTTLFLIGLASVFVGAWWITLGVGVILALRFRAWEVVLLGILVDVLYLPFASVYGIPVATLGMLVMVWALEPVRSEFLMS
jgi:hypothetical protein